MFRRAKIFLLVLSAIGLSVSIPSEAQQEGNVGIYNGGSSPSPSTAIIDVTPYYYNQSGTPDFCFAINTILTSTGPTGYATLYPNGAVLDARGLLEDPSSPLFCAANPFQTPYVSPTGLVTVPSTILLPAIQIGITSPWVLPSNTRIIGENSQTSQLTADTGWVGSAMIEMCNLSPAATCNGITIEHLKLNNPSALATDGIDNYYAQDGSYVDDVVFSNFGATSSTGITNACTLSTATGTVTGLCISPNATYSGPYTNIDFSASSSFCGGYTCAPTACVKIQAQTRGLHGITCTAKAAYGNTPYPGAAIYLDSYNNTIEDVHVEGFYDGVVVGDYADGQGGAMPNTSEIAASSNTISNVTAAQGRGYVANTIHICNPSTANNVCAGTNKEAVSNITVLEALSKGTGGTGACSTGICTSTIEDDNISTTAINLLATPAFVGMYTLGGSVGLSSSSVGYTRLTTSPGPGNSFNGNTVVTPTWGVGDSAPPSSCVINGQANYGAIYSNTSGSPHTIYVCNSSGTWTPIG